MIYGYVSFHEKGISNALSIEEQKALIYQRYPSAENIIVERYQNPVERPNLINEIEKMYGRDTIVVHSLDRLCGSIKGILDIVEMAEQKNIRINVLTLGSIDSTPAGKSIVNTLRAMLDFERTMMIERTKIGKAIAKENPNFREGRPQKYSEEKISKALKMLETMSYKAVEKEMGISKSTLIRAKRKEVNG